MNKLAALFVLLALSHVPAEAQTRPKALFYLSDNAVGVHSFLEHQSKIDILVPTWYDVDESGLVTGEPNPLVLRTAKAAHISVVPIFALTNKDKVHLLIGDLAAQQHMNEAFIRECQENGYDGIQFDFEDVMWTDRDGFSAMVKRTADALHPQHLQVQIASVPNAPGHAGHTAFGKWIYEEWRGAYDIKALAESVDLLCLMTYDQHTRWTSPGPVAGWAWTNDNLAYALKVVPPAKLSLGIPLYGYHWFTGDPGLDKKEKTPNSTAEYISGPNVQFLRDTFNVTPQWDELDHTPWFFFYRDQMREWVFYTDRRSFSERYDLVKKNNLQGFCSWVLGEEDPTIWAALPDRR